MQIVLIEVQIFTEQRRNGRGRVFNQWLRTYKTANKRWNVREKGSGGREERGGGNFFQKSEKNDWSVWVKKVNGKVKLWSLVGRDF